jgi:hypothetical protein
MCFMYFILSILVLPETPVSTTGKAEWLSNE